MKFIAIRFWDNSSQEDLLGSFNSEVEAQEAIDQDFEVFGSREFVIERVAYRIGFQRELGDM